MLNDKNKDINNEREHRFVAYFARVGCGGVVVLVLGKREREREREKIEHGTSI